MSVVSIAFGKIGSKLEIFRIHEYTRSQAHGPTSASSCTTGLIQNRVSRLATRLARSTAKAKEQRVVYVEEEKPTRANSNERTRGPESRRVSYNDHGVRLGASAAKSFSLSLVLSLSLGNPSVVSPPRRSRIIYNPYRVGGAVGSRCTRKARSHKHATS